MKAKNIPVDYVADLCTRIEQGETPRKSNALAPKEFLRQMLPHAKVFLAQGYTYKEIADFLGHISADDLKKAVAKEAPAPTKGKQMQAGPEKTAPPPIPGKKSKAGKAPQPGV